MNGHDEPGFASICTKADWERWQRDAEGFWKYDVTKEPNYCDSCEKIVVLRWLDCADCEEKGRVCPIVICTECGGEISGSHK